VEGNALKEIRELPQIISGATDSCQLLGLDIFQDLVNSVTPLAKIESAELVKIMGNAYRDYIFGFSNYFIDICREYKLDINSIIEASNRGYPRSTIPNPSPGVGGPCLSKDSYFLPERINTTGISPLIAARQVNESIPLKSVDFIKAKISHISKFRCVGIGIAFKGTPETNDFRNSPSIDFLNAIKENVSSINVWDYLIVENSNELGFSFASSNEEYDFYAILNNNPRNFDYFNNRVLKNKSNEIIVFDPWRIVTLNQISASNDVKLIHYFSLSHYQKIII
jgi:nucleotide sugar dehydrogenase